jgi:hypothetical protein
MHPSKNTPANIIYTITNTSNPNSKDFKVNITHFHDTVAILKKAIFKKTKIPPANQLLLGNNQQLEDSKELIGDYKLKHGSTILLVEQRGKSVTTEVPVKKQKPRVVISVPACSFKIDLKQDEQFTVKQIQKELLARVQLKIGARHLDWKAQGKLPRIGDHDVTLEFKGADYGSGKGKKVAFKNVKNMGVKVTEPKEEVNRRAVLVSGGNMRPRTSEKGPERPNYGGKNQFGRSSMTHSKNLEFAGDILNFEKEEQPKPANLSKNRSPFANAKVGGFFRQAAQKKQKSNSNFTGGQRFSPFTNAIVGRNANDQKKNMANQLKEGLQKLTFAPNQYKKSSSTGNRGFYGQATANQNRAYGNLNQSRPFGAQQPKRPAPGYAKKHSYGVNMKRAAFASRR